MNFLNDDDKTPQGKIARGCMYLIAVCGLFLFGFGVVVPTVMWFVGGTVEHFTPQPTADQVYGCTIKQQAPNGDCP